MRVGFDMTPSLVSPAGVGRYPRELLEALRHINGVETVVLQSGGTAPRSSLTRVSQGLVRELWYYPIGLGRRARAAGVDVVHVPAPFTPRHPRRPLVMTLHDVLPFARPELFPRKIRMYSSALVGTALRRADIVVTGTRHSRTLAIDHLGLDPARVVVTRYGVHPRFHPDPDAAERARAKFATGPRYVLCVGTLEPRKNLIGVLRAFAAVAGGTDCRLVIAGGEGWLNDDFERELERIDPKPIMTGFVSDDELVGLYSGAACFVYPSLYEGFGFPPLEAMACGAPVVTSSTSTLPEVAGDAALLVEPTDHDALSAALDAVLGSSATAEDLRRRGLEHVKGFSWERCAEQTLAAYELARRRRKAAA